MIPILPENRQKEMEAIDQSAIETFQRASAVQDSVMYVFASPAGLALAGLCQMTPREIILIPCSEEPEIVELFLAIMRCGNWLGAEILLNEMSQRVSLNTKMRVRFKELMELGWCASGKYESFSSVEITISEDCPNLESVVQVFGTTQVEETAILPPNYDFDLADNSFDFWKSEAETYYWLE